jgi:hypothetical protein
MSCAQAVRVIPGRREMTHLCSEASPYVIAHTSIQVMAWNAGFWAKKLSLSLM